jgi:hypothetical protein
MNTNIISRQLTLRVLMSILLLSSTSSFGQEKQPPASSATNQPKASTLSEGEAYLAWYDARGAGDYTRAVSLANSYLERFPAGDGAFFIRTWLKAASKQMKRQAAADEAGLKDLFEETVSGRTLLLASLLEDLIDDRTEVDMRIKDGKTALMLASAMGREEVVKALIQMRANVNAKEVHGWNALTYAIWSGNAGVVRMLLEGGADARARDDKNRTALDHAKIAGDTEIIQLVEKAGGKD